MSFESFGLFDIIIIILFVFGVLEGYKRGAVKQINDILFLFISMILSSLASGFITNLLCPFLPFFNFFGAAKGLKTINIIFYRVLIYLILIIAFMIILDKILIKLRLKGKIMDSMVDATKISQIVGAILGIPLISLVVYNLIFIVALPILPFGFNSLISDKIMYNVPVVSSLSSNIYDTELLVLEQVNSDANNYDEYETVNNEISSILVDGGIIDEEKIDILSGSDKLLGSKADQSQTSPGNNSSDDSDDDYGDDYDDDYGDDYDDDYGDDSSDSGDDSGDNADGEVCEMMQEEGVDVEVCQYEDGSYTNYYPDYDITIYCDVDDNCEQCDAEGNCFEME